MNSESSKISYPHSLTINLLDKINLKRSDKYVALSNLSIYYTWKKLKMSKKNVRYKKSARIGITNMNYLMNHIMYQIFEMILKLSSKT